MLVVYFQRVLVRTKEEEDESFSKLCLCMHCIRFDDCIVEFMDNGRWHVTNFLDDLPKENYVIAYFSGKR